MGWFHSACVAGLGLGLVACADGASPAGQVPSVAPPSEPPRWQPTHDLTETMFDPDRLLRIEIELPPADWDELRHQSRNIFDVIGSSCLEDPPPRPFTYFRGTVAIDGQLVEDVGIRKKGFFGSLSDTKPSLKVKFSEYVPGQRYSGLKRMTLNNAKSDPSYIKQCLGYRLFEQAGIPSPRCNFATVSINGQSLGLYTHIESIKKRFLARHFDDNDGNLYEGALSDFRDGWVNTFQKKTNKQDTDRSDIEALVPVLSGDDGSSLAQLEPLIDIDAFMTFWAAELLVMHADGYARNTNNFYVYADPDTNKFHFIPWGIDAIMFPDTVLPWESQQPPASVWAEGVLARRLYQLPETQVVYRNRLRQLLATVWNETDLHAEIDRMEALISPYVGAAERARFEAALTRVRNFVNARRAVIEAELNGTAPAWDQPLREPWCIDMIGSITATFDTEWGTIGAQDPFDLGSLATISLTLHEQSVAALSTAALAGLDNDSARPAVQVVLRTMTTPTVTEIVLVHIAVKPELFVPGAEVSIDGDAAGGYVVELRLEAGEDPALSILGVVADGTLTLSEASTVDGQAVSGQMTATVFESVF